MIHNQEVQINELQNQLSETVSLDDKQQETPQPDYEIIEEQPAPVDEKSEKRGD
jgi:hypothetical protein